ncbi:cytochrome c oxidase subunit II [Natronosalvus caseinilyticus]|uniref:cytochrome c oxidase subunit II n=1 Tax=Natronosalvus caseinilyticus TaxID=2953747 RepID=UPI0028A8DB6E|nr:cytochrome c oxidase subunit II [Natronosalvus caseinilyticus]
MTRVDIFQELFLVFLGLGTIVGIIVVAYILYNAYKYRDDGERHSDEDLPTLGELPTGGSGGKKLFVSFFLSALIVISLTLWSYGMLIDVESGPEGPGEDALEVDVEGQTFSWSFYYENGVESSNELVVPAGTPVWVDVTSVDVWHSFGITSQRVKADAIPGESDQTWFQADEEGEYLIECFELCGPGHSSMEGTLTVMSQEDYDQWVQDQLTLTLTLEDSEGETVNDTENVEVTVQDPDGETVGTYTGEDFDDEGALEISVEQGDTYTVIVESTDGSFETTEDDFEIVDGPEESLQLGGSDGGDGEDESSSEDENGNGNGNGNESEDSGGEN